VLCLFARGCQSKPSGSVPRTSGGNTKRDRTDGCLRNLSCLPSLYMCPKRLLDYHWCMSKSTKNGHLAKNSFGSCSLPWGRMGSRDIVGKERFTRRVHFGGNLCAKKDLSKGGLLSCEGTRIPKLFQDGRSADGIRAVPPACGQNSRGRSTETPQSLALRA
jgi:hypothetical protein